MSARIHEVKMVFAQTKLPDGAVMMSLSLDGKTFFLTANFTPEQWEDFQSGRAASEVDTYHRNPPIE